MILAGIVALVAVGGEVGAHGFSMAIGVGLAVMLLNLLYRMSVSGDRDRAREDEARRYFDEHGVWPDDEDHSSASVGAGGRGRAERSQQSRRTPTAGSLTDAGLPRPWPSDDDVDTTNAVRLAERPRVRLRRGSQTAG
jgi:hypothetical protein